MGLDLHAYSTFERDATVMDEEADEHFVKPLVYMGFEHGLEGIATKEEWERSGGSATGIVYAPQVRVGGSEATAHWSYGGYNDVRRVLSRFFLDAAPDEVWADPDAYRNKPMFDLIQFADNEGTMGPVASRRIADVMTPEARERFMEWVAEHYGTEEGGTVASYYLSAWDSIHEVFSTAADTGLVCFH